MYFDPRWARGHGLERLAARMAQLAPPATRPALHARLAALAWTAPAGLADLVEAIYDDHENELPDADLACVGHDLIARGRSIADRACGCVWLTLFPSVEAATALAAIVRDADEPAELRDQAAWTLGFRQVQERSAQLVWPAEAVAIGDAALADAFLADTDGALDQLPEACQHVGARDFHDRLAAALGAGTLPLARAVDAIDAFASPALAAALLDRIGALDARHAGVVIPLIAHTLGDDAAPALLAFAAAAPIAPRCEAIWGALAFAPERAADAAAALVAEHRVMPQLGRRADWHRAHPRIVPLTRALQIARTTAVLAPADRPAAARLACAYFGAIAALESPLPGDAFPLWRHCAFLSDEPASVIACAELDRAALDRAPFLLPRLLDALARTGRFAELVRTATARGERELACWLLARGGRPFLALAMRRRARADDRHAVAGQALALFACGRPDLAARTLALPAPRDEDVTWRDLAALAALAVPAPPGADPDVVDVAAVAAIERALAADLAGASVHLAGRFPDRAALTAAIERRGGLVVSGGFGKVDYVLTGDDVDPEELARLTSLGAIPISPLHL